MPKKQEALIAANKNLLLQNETKEIETEELIVANNALKEAEEKINKANHLYAFISQVNQNIVRVRDETTMFNNACRIAIEFGKFKMAWIGLFGTNKSITLIKQNGIPKEDIQLFTDSPYANNGPQDFVLRNSTYYICNDIEHDLNLEKWKLYATANGIRSCLVLPIRKSGNIIGTFNLYSTELNFSGQEEIKLLIEVTGDISFALDLFEKEKQHREADEAIKASEHRYHSLFDNMLEGFACCKMIYKDGDAKDFIYQDVNDAFGRLTGLKNVIGKKVTEVIPTTKEDNPELFKLYTRVAFTGQAERSEVYIPTIKKWFDLSVYSTEQGYFTVVFDEITERKRAEQQREFDRNNLDALINNTHDLMWSVDRNFKLITANKPFDDSCKINFGHIVDKGVNILSTASSPEMLDHNKSQYERAFAGEIFTETRYSHRPDNSWSEISYYPIRSGTEIMGAACHSHDITHRKKAQREIDSLNEKLQATNQELSAILNTLPANVALLNENGMIIAVDDAWIQFAEDNHMHNSTHGLGDNYITICEKATGTESQNATEMATGLRNILNGSLKQFAMEYPCHSPSVKRWFQVEVRPLAGGKKVGAVVMHIDITERKISEEALRLSEIKLRTIFETEPECVKILDTNGHIMDMNPAGLAMFEADSLEQLLNKNSTALVDKSYQAAHQNLITNVFKGHSGMLQFEVTGMKGTRLWLETHAVPMKDADGKIVSLLAVTRNITQRKKAEAELLLSEQYHRALIENISDAIVLINENFETLYISESSVRMTGFSLEDAINLPVFHFIHPDDVQDCMAFFQRVYANPGVPQHNQYRTLHKLGHYIWIEGTIINLLHNESVKAFVVNYRDITERKNAEAEINSLNENLENRVHERTTELTEANIALEAFSYSVSHDLRAPVRSVLGFTRIIKSEYGTDMEPDLLEMFDHIQSSGKRMDAIIEDLLSLAKYGKAKLRLNPLNMHDLFEEVWAENNQESKSRTEFELSELPPVMADSSMMRQVVVNLLSNAIKYSSKKEKTSVKVGFEEKEGEVIFSVADNGAGFNMKNYDQLFGAFQRLHGMSEFEGTGVGLMIVKSIIDKHHGRVWAEGIENEGATFYFSLPTVS